MHPLVFSVFTLYPDIFKNDTEQEEEKHMQNQNGRRLKMPPIRLSQIKKKKI